MASDIPEAMTFRPSMEEFKDVNKYILSMEAKGAHLGGIAKIIPPSHQWKIRKCGYKVEDINLSIPGPIKQVITGAGGVYQTRNIVQSEIEVNEYELLAKNYVYATPDCKNVEELEKKYWSEITDTAPINCLDVSASLIDKDCGIWNFRNLKSILNQESGAKIIKAKWDDALKKLNAADSIPTQIETEGVAPSLNFGMWKSSFSWSVEDMDLYSINLLHFGAPKTWYFIPPQYGHMLEKASRDLYPDMAAWCSNFLRHKSCLISPTVLDELKIPYHKFIQKPGEIIIVFPFAYNSGFSHGFNCAESVNYATERWVEYGKRYRPCDCTKIVPKFGMEPFILEFQPDRYFQWKRNQDFGPHPEDPQNVKNFFKEALKASDVKEFLSTAEEIPKEFKMSYWGYDTELNKYRLRYKDSDELKIVTLAVTSNTLGTFSFTARNGIPFVIVGKCSNAIRNYVKKYSITYLIRNEMVEKVSEQSFSKRSEDKVTKEIKEEIQEVVIKEEVAIKEEMAFDNHELLDVPFHNFNDRSINIKEEPVDDFFVDTANIEMEDEDIEEDDLEDEEEVGDDEDYVPDEEKDESTQEKGEISTSIKIGKGRSHKPKIIEIYETKEKVTFSCHKDSKLPVGQVKNQIKDMLEGSSVEELIENGTFTKVGEKIFGSNEPQRQKDPQLKQKFNKFLTKDGEYITITRTKKIIERVKNRLEFKIYNSIKEKLDKFTIKELIKEDYLIPYVAPSIVEKTVEVYKTDSGVVVNIMKDTQQIASNQPASPELFSLIAENSVEQLIKDKILKKIREDKIIENQSKNDPYLHRDFVKFYLRNNIPITITKHKKIIDSFKTLPNVDYEEIQAILYKNHIVDLIKNGYLCHEPRKETLDVPTNIDPYLTQPWTTFLTKDHIRIRINQLKQLHKNCKFKGIDYEPIQKILFEERIQKLVMNGYLKEYDESMFYEVKGGRHNPNYLYKGQLFAISYEGKITYTKGQAELYEEELQALLDMRGIEALLFDGIVHKAPSIKSKQKNADGKVETKIVVYKTLDTDPPLKFRINEETGSLQGKHAGEIVDYLRGTSVDKLLSEKRIVVWCETVALKTPHMDEKNKEVWMTMDGLKVCINKKTMRLFGRCAEPIRAKFAAGETIESMIKCGYLKKLTGYEGPIEDNPVVDKTKEEKVELNTISPPRILNPTNIVKFMKNTNVLTSVSMDTLVNSQIKLEASSLADPLTDVPIKQEPIDPSSMVSIKHETDTADLKIGEIVGMKPMKLKVFKRKRDNDIQYITAKKATMIAPSVSESWATTSSTKEEILNRKQFKAHVMPLSKRTCKCGTTVKGFHKGHRRRQKCRTCAGCTRDECGLCPSCQDMPRFGGPGRMKQRCELKMCLDPILPNCPCFT